MESERDLRFITTASPMARRQADGLCSCRQRRHTCKWRLMPPDLACSDALVQSRHRPFVPRPPPARCARHPAAAAALDHAQESLQVSDNLLAVPVCVVTPPRRPLPGRGAANTALADGCTFLGLQPARGFRVEVCKAGACTGTLPRSRPLAPPRLLEDVGVFAQRRRQRRDAPKQFVRVRA